MAVTVVQFTSNDGTAPGVDKYTTFSTNVTVGNKIVVGGFTPSGPITVSDNLGNTYTQVADVDNVWGMQCAALFVADVEFGGACTVRCDNSPFTFHPAYAMAEFNGLGDAIHGVIGIGFYPYTLGGLYPLGIVCGPMPTSDTYIVTLRGLSGGDPLPTPPPQMQSDTGDTFIGWDSGFRASMWGRQESTPGVTNVKIQSSGLYGLSAAQVSVAFSKPLTTPGGLTKQFALKPGWGMTPQAWVSPPPTDGSYNKDPSNTFATMKTVRTHLPYEVDVGSLLLVVAIQNFAGTTHTFTISDDYGNTYNLLDEEVSAGGVVCSVYKCIVTNVPAAGQVFEVTLEVAYTGGNGTYAHPGIALAEYKGATDAGLAAAFFQSSTFVSGDDYRMITFPLTVIAGTPLFAVCASAPNVSTDLLTWTEDDDYAIQNSWGIASNDFGTVNRPRNKMMAVMEKVATSDGNYEASILASTGGAGNEEMVLVSVPSAAIALACPVDNTLTLNVPYSGTLTVVGGTGPFTFALIS